MRPGGLSRPDRFNGSKPEQQPAAQETPRKTRQPRKPKGS